VHHEGGFSWAGIPYLSNVNQSGAFGGPGMSEDILYGAGSDDFRGYVWKIPELSTLLGFRQEISADEWMTHEWTGACGEFLDSPKVILVHLSRTPAYSESQWATRYIPLQIDTPLCRLNGVKFNDRNDA
jgi:WD repeat-containing protein 22